MKPSGAARNREVILAGTARQRRSRRVQRRNLKRHGIIARRISPAKMRAGTPPRGLSTLRRVKRQLSVVVPQLN